MSLLKLYNPLATKLAYDDLKDKVVVAILKAMLHVGNKPLSPKELASEIIRFGFCQLGGATPHATVSGRLSQHFKRCSEANRKSVIEKIPVMEKPRKFRYRISPSIISQLMSGYSKNDDDDDSDNMLPHEAERRRGKKRKILTLKKRRKLNKQMESSIGNSLLENEDNQRTGESDTETNSVDDADSDSNTDDDDYPNSTYTHSTDSVNGTNGVHDHDNDAIDIVGSSDEFSSQIDGHIAENGAKDESRRSTDSEYSTNDINSRQESPNPWLFPSSLSDKHNRLSPSHFPLSPSRPSHHIEDSVVDTFGFDYSYSASTSGPRFLSEEDGYDYESVADPEMLSVNELDNLFGGSSASSQAARSRKVSGSSAIRESNQSRSLGTRHLDSDSSTKESSSVPSSRNSAAQIPKRKRVYSYDATVVDSVRKRIRNDHESMNEGHDRATLIARLQSSSTLSNSDNIGNTIEKMKFERAYRRRVSSMNMAELSTGSSTNSSQIADKRKRREKESSPMPLSKRNEAAEDVRSNTTAKQPHNRTSSPNRSPLESSTLTPSKPTSFREHRLSTSSSTNKSLLLVESSLRISPMQDISVSSSTAPQTPLPPFQSTDPQYYTKNFKPLESLSLEPPTTPLPIASPPIFLATVENSKVYLCILTVNPVVTQEEEEFIDLSDFSSSVVSTRRNSRYNIRSNLPNPPKSPRNSTSKSPRLRPSSSSYSPRTRPEPKSPRHKTFNLEPLPPPSLAVPSSASTNSQTQPQHSSQQTSNVSNQKTYYLLRRIDTNFVNATTLLFAGGIESEQERSIVLSLERGRIRVRSKREREGKLKGKGKKSSNSAASGAARVVEVDKVLGRDRNLRNKDKISADEDDEITLEGTWIPLPRARALASTCTLDHRLSYFLSDDLSTYFPPQADSIIPADPLNPTKLAKLAAKTESDVLPLAPTVASPSAVPLPLSQEEGEPDSSQYPFYLSSMGKVVSQDYGYYYQYPEMYPPVTNLDSQSTPPSLPNVAASTNLKSTGTLTSKPTISSSSAARPTVAVPVTRKLESSSSSSQIPANLHPQIFRMTPNKEALALSASVTASQTSVSESAPLAAAPPARSAVDDDETEEEDIEDDVVTGSSATTKNGGKVRNKGNNKNGTRNSKSQEKETTSKKGADDSKPGKSKGDKKSGSNSSKTKSNDKKSKSKETVKSEDLLKSKSSSKANSTSEKRNSQLTEQDDTDDESLTTNSTISNNLRRSKRERKRRKSFDSDDTSSSSEAEAEIARASERSRSLKSKTKSSVSSSTSKSRSDALSSRATSSTNRYKSTGGKIRPIQSPSSLSSGGTLKRKIRVRATSSLLGGNAVSTGGKSASSIRNNRVSSSGSSPSSSARNKLTGAKLRRVSNRRGRSKTPDSGSEREKDRERDSPFKTLTGGKTRRPSLRSSSRLGSGGKRRRYSPSTIITDEESDYEDDYAITDSDADVDGHGDQDDGYSSHGSTGLSVFYKGDVVMLDKDEDETDDEKMVDVVGGTDEE